MDTIVDAVITLLRSSIGDISGITADTTLAELDLDSLVLVELSVGLQSRFGTELILSGLPEDRTVGDIALLVSGALPAS